MSLWLTIVSYHKITPGQCSEQQLEQGMLAIGRGADNDWVLADPERLVSTRHCTIQFKDGRYYLTDCSTNGVELVRAGVRLRRGNSELLNDGEVIRIGEYEIQARVDLSVSVAGLEPVAGENFGGFEALLRNQTPPPAPYEQTPNAAPFSGAQFDSKPGLFDFLTPPPIPAPTQPDHVPADRHDFRAPMPFAPVTNEPRTPTPPPAPVVQPPVGNLAIPENWDLLAEAPLAEPELAANPFEGMNVAQVDFPNSFTPAPPLDLAKPEPLAPPLSELPPFVAPPALPEPPAMPKPPQPPYEPAPSVELLQAFLRGAGLDKLHLDTAQAAAQMESIGRSYRLMVEGMIDVLRARTSLKSEFRMAQTMIRPVENNPLKFAPNADEALLLLLRHGNQTFMAPEQAVTDSFHDLKAHQLAVMAGVEAALKHVIARFEPAELEGRLNKSNGISALFGSKQAQHWQRFIELYASISREAEEDFQDLFGREFSRAYEQHSARLRRP